ncbi:LysR family transcriptional regulator [Pseudoalteromonas xiamenensis]
MDRLGAMEIFIRLSELGSFTAVAEEANLSKSKISKEISKLEEYVGARLLHRSTRHLQLTSLGMIYLKRCKSILREVEEAHSDIQLIQKRPAGKLKISLPMALGLTELSPIFTEFMRLYPHIELEVFLSDESIDLIEQGFDVGFRAASATFDSNYVGKKLTQFNYHVVASPEYLSAHAPILVPEDLERHNCFVYRYFRKKNVWPVGQGVAVNGSLKANSTIFMLDLVRAGHGIGFFPDFVCQKAIDDGEIVSILSEHNTAKLTLYAMYPARHHVPTSLRHFLDFFEQWFKKKNDLKSSN